MCPSPEVFAITEPTSALSLTPNSISTLSTSCIPSRNFSSADVTALCTPSSASSNRARTSWTTSPGLRETDLKARFAGIYLNNNPAVIALPPDQLVQVPSTILARHQH